MAPVEYLNYLVVEELGWSIDDDDLFALPVASIWTARTTEFLKVTGTPRYWRLRASRERLSNLTRAFAAMGIDHTVDYVGDVGDEDDAPLLTERQRRLVEVALKIGYYDTPRTSTLDDVAGEVDLAKSTCSEILHRAEGKVLENFVESS